MNENELVDAESAYGSEISSNSSFLIKKDTFKIKVPTPRNQNRWQETTSRNRIRWKWLIYKLRDYMILETIFFLILIFLLITCYRITSQNQETQKMIMSIQSQLDSIQKSTEKDFMNIKEDGEETIENEFEKLKTTLKEDLKKNQMEPVVQLKQNQSIINSTEKLKKTHAPSTIQTAAISPPGKQFNAASLIADATIDTSLSSSSSLNPIIGFDQSSLVLVDRPVPPANKAWCTSDKNPVLTVNLGWYIKPTAVSYQHSKWNEMIPDDAPKEYSVEACLDYYCMSRKPLFSNCEYSQHGLQEQICNNTSYDLLSSPVEKIAKLQFRFHKNHGNTERTCVSLVKVYSETEVVKEKKLRRLEDTTTCLKVNHRYHHYPKMYKYFTYKNCSLLYSKGCCQECPECCEECDIYDINLGVIGSITVLMICFFILIVLFFPLIVLICK